MRQKPNLAECAALGAELRTHIPSVSVDGHAVAHVRATLLLDALKRPSIASQPCDDSEPRYPICPECNGNITVRGAESCPDCGLVFYPPTASPAIKAMALLLTVARMKYDGEEINCEDGEPFVMENDDAVDTLNNLIVQAREIINSQPEDQHAEA